MNRRVDSRIGIVLAISVLGLVRSLPIKIVSDINVTAVINARVVLPCTPRVPDDVRWCFHHTPQSECDEVAISGHVVGDHIERFELQDNELTMTSFADDLSGVYVCVEEHGTGDMHRVNLTAKTLLLETVTAFTNPAFAEKSTLSESFILHNATGETDEEDSTYVIIGVIVGGFLSAAVVLIITFTVLNFKCDIFKRHKRAETQKKKSDEASWLLDAAVVELEEKIKTLFNEAKKDRQTRDPCIMDQLHECRYLTRCANWVGSYVNGLDRKPNAVVGIQGLSESGSLLASRVAELLGVRLILLRISDPKTQGNQAAANGETTRTLDNRELTAHLELRPERDNDIRQVIIVDMEITGRNMKAAVDEVARKKLHVIKCIVINYVSSCTSGVNDVHALVRLDWNPVNNN